MQKLENWLVNLTGTESLDDRTVSDRGVSAGAWLYC